MRTNGFRTGFLVFAMALAPLHAQAEEGAKAVDAAWEKAMKAGDLDALVACYAPDAVMWLPGAPEARGAKAIRDAYAALLSGNTVTSTVFSNTVYETRGDWSVGWGDVVVTLAPKAGGAPTPLLARFTVVAKKLGGRWVYVSDHASSGPAPPAAPTP
ncbi:MAG: SgcJ/EcaC family oxidoreductase [Thermoanaerobaculia bacterium]